MANTIYASYREALLAANSVASLNQNTTTDGPYCLLIDTGTYAFNGAHNMRDDVTTGIVGSEMRIVNPTITGGLFDGDNLTFASVAAGTTAEALLIYRKNTGATSTQLLVTWMDTSVTGLPVTTNGGDINLGFHVSGIFQL